MEQLTNEFINNSGYYYFYNAILQGFTALWGLVIVGLIYRFQEWNYFLQNSLLMRDIEYRTKYRKDIDTLKNTTINMFKKVSYITIGIIGSSAFFMVFKGILGVFLILIFTFITFITVFIGIFQYLKFVNFVLTIKYPKNI